MSRLLSALLLAVVLAGCAAPGPAPVRDAQSRNVPQPAAARTVPEVVRPATPQIAPSTNGLHTVARGDTLFAIAFANSLDHRELAVWNRLSSPDRILVGQVLRLTPPPGATEVKPLEAAPKLVASPLAEPPLLRAPQAIYLDYSAANWAQVSGVQPNVSASPPVVAGLTPPAPTPRPDTSTGWLWPAEGTLIARFGEAGGKGIGIAAARNTPIRAAAAGKVVYSGSGLRGYGHLVIVRHTNEYLSAYAHNETILVKEGETIAAGQKIGLMGDSGTDRVKLHFEIRRHGKALDPLTYLPERS